MRAHILLPFSLLIAGAALVGTTLQAGSAAPAGTVAAAGPVRAGPVTKLVNIKKLPLGAKITKVAFVERDWTKKVAPLLHRPGKSTVKLPLSWRSGAVALLGSGTHGYVVRNGTSNVSLFNVSNTGPVRFYLDGSRRYRGEARLTADGGAVVVSGVPSGGSALVARRVTVTGTVGSEVSIGPDSRLIGTFGSAAVFPHWYGPTHVWRFGIGVQNLTGNRAALVDRAHNRLFVDTSGSSGPQAIGPTSLSSPGVPAWTADFSPQTVSPDGRLVAGWAGQGNTVLQVRRVSSGAVVARFTSATATVEGDRIIEPQVWETNTALLLTTWTAGDRWAISRCTMSGHCVRATAIRDGRIVFPIRDHPYGWWVY